ncbi:lipoprotein [Bordetella pertussis]|nr:lipoprotein [Bordetella pertussis]
MAYVGLGANPPEDVLYPVTAVDARGKALRSDEDYVLHFDKDQLPPANAFWSLILYDARQGLGDNPIDRYALRSTDPLVYNADGSLDIYIQRDPPRKARQANWLPAPQQGDFMLNLRLYWPRDIALDGNWAPPAVRED